MSEIADEHLERIFENPCEYCGELYGEHSEDCLCFDDEDFFDD